VPRHLDDLVQLFVGGGERALQLRRIEDQPPASRKVALIRAEIGSSADERSRDSDALAGIQRRIDALSEGDDDAGYG
jgi:hypothetical protein